MLIHPGGPLLLQPPHPGHRALLPITENPFSTGWKNEVSKWSQACAPGRKRMKNFQLLNLFSKDNFAHTKQQFTTV